jgi:hypothetical protein
MKAVDMPTSTEPYGASSGGTIRAKPMSLRGDYSPILRE